MVTIRPKRMTLPDSGAVGDGATDAGEVAVGDGDTEPLWSHAANPTTATRMRTRLATLI
jgi:hypothetical protein